MVKKDYNKTPQEVVSEFWDNYFSKKQGKVTSIFPRSLYANLLPPNSAKGSSSARNAAESYEAAAKECRDKVARIVRECSRTNEKFTDPDFDIENDGDSNCLNGLVRSSSSTSSSVSSSSGTGSAHGARSALSPPLRRRLLGPSEVGLPVGLGQNAQAPWKRGMRGDEDYSPGSVHRVDWIFDSPKFTIDGYSSSDIKQGSDGDCWWLAAVATIAHRKDLMEKVCVARDEECGVYGFVFERDGDWVSVVVDDNLYLTREDFDFYNDQYDSTGRRAREYRRTNQTGSSALYFSKCADQNETWLPLLEKAYAKIHGDYEAISGGWSGEGVEDMTGGVNTTVVTNRVLRKDRLWKELVNSNGDFVFALSAMGNGYDSTKGGLRLGHAYSVLDATEEVGEDGTKVRLVKVRNPWGERDWKGIGEWNGPWSDGSKEWTPYWLKKINHIFGDDGIFWISYEDMLSTFMFLHRTRLFDERWTVVQQWTSVSIGWLTGYLRTRFLIEVEKAGMVVIVFSQLDSRYFQGLEGQYTFTLHFILKELDGRPGEHLCRVRPVHDWESRSISCEVELGPGKYEVLPKITASRYTDEKTVEDVVQEMAETNPQKLRQIGLLYDLAHAKGGIDDEDELIYKKNEEKKRKEKAKKAKERAKKAKEKAKKKKEKQEQKKKTKEEKEAAEKAVAEKEAAEKEAAEKAVAEKEAVEKEKNEANGDKKDEQPNREKTKTAGAAQGQKQGPDAVKESTEAGNADPKEEPKLEDAQGKSCSSDDCNENGKNAKNDEGKSKEDSGKAKEEEQDDDDDDDDDEPEAEEETPAATVEDGAPPPWNAVAVIGLRVYAQDPNVTISLVKPRDRAEGASLAVDATTPAGATM